MFVPAGTLLEVAPGIPLVGYLRLIPTGHHLEDWQLFSCLQSLQ